MNPTGLLNSDPLRLGIVGLGTVGCAVIEILQHQAEAIAARANRPVEVVAVSARTKDRARSVDITPFLWCDDPFDVAAHADVDVVVELTGGTEMPHALAKAALSLDKPWISANKALLAEQGAELVALAHQQRCVVGFEAAVCGAIPAIKTLREALAGNRVRRISGIMNGTCNYIFALLADNHAFESALVDAQAKGYAEADPTLDIEGIDAAHKVALLASLASGQRVAFDQLLIEGIAATPPAASFVLGAVGYAVKLIAEAKQTDAGWQVMVAPMALKSDHPLSQIHGVTNAVMFSGDASGEIIQSGAGAGGAATASAVVADIIDIAADRGVIAGGLPKAEAGEVSLLSEGEQQHVYLLSSTSEDVLAAFAEAETIAPNVYCLGAGVHQDVMAKIANYALCADGGFWIRQAT